MLLASPFMAMAAVLLSMLEQLETLRFAPAGVGKWYRIISRDRMREALLLPGLDWML